MRIKRIAVWIVVSAFLITVAGLGLEGVWAQTADPLSATISVGPNATLLAKGAAVSVPVSYSCVAAEGVTVTDGSVSVRLDQVVKKSVYGAYGYTPISPVCDGQQHSVDVVVYANSGVPWRKGVALAASFINVYGQDASGGEYGGYVSTGAGASAEVKIQ